MDKLIEMKNLIKSINEHNYKYYTLDNPEISDSEYNKMYDRLITLEKELGVVYSDSPSLVVGWTTNKNLQEEKHKIKLLSLDKTKDVHELKKFMGDKECVIMAKGDGLTIKLEYIKELIKGMTRGNGKVGEIITHNVKKFKNLPLRIPDVITVVGEGLITMDDFEKYIETLEEDDRKKTLRSFTAGTVRRLSNEETAKRGVRLLAFGTQNTNRFKTKIEELQYLENLGFEVIPYKLTSKETIEEDIEKMKTRIELLGIPYDGMVITFNDVSLYEKYGTTIKYPKYSMAFKFEDEVEETIIQDIVYEPSRNGRLTPVAVFNLIELDGSDVTRATIGSQNIFNELKLKKGDRITVCKANQIVPKIVENLDKEKYGQLIQKISVCPICGAKVIEQDCFLFCSNKHCSMRQDKKIDHFCGREGLNIKGLSEKTISSINSLGLLNNYIDLFNLKSNKEVLVNLSGFGEKKFEKLIDNIEKARNVSFNKFICGLGIPNIGVKASEDLLKININPENIFNTSLNTFVEAIGDVKGTSIYKYLNENKDMLEKLMNEFEFIEEKDEVTEENLKGLKFVITGSLETISRKDLEKIIKSKGGEVSKSISKNTSYLINNDITSTSSKNEKAKKMGILIIDEEMAKEIIGF
ncbi:NAD-dependent DNA ligase LigA [Clostridium perfringens]|nr:NAD-dependent DNA ligase LigA [Clostridium perfringens]